MISNLFIRLGGGIPAIIADATNEVTANSRSLIQRLGISVFASFTLKCVLMFATLNYVLDWEVWNWALTLLLVSIILSFDVLLLSTCWSDRDSGAVMSGFKLGGRIVFALAVSFVLSLGIVQFIAGPLINEKFEAKEKSLNAPLYSRLDDERTRLEQVNEQVGLRLSTLVDKKDLVGRDLRTLRDQLEQEHQRKREWDSKSKTEETGVGDDDSVRAKGLGEKWKKAVFEAKLAEDAIARIDQEITAQENQSAALDEEIRKVRAQANKNNQSIANIRLNADRLVSRDRSYQRVKDGFLQRFEAMQTIKSENPQMGLLATFIGVVIALLEVMPVLLAHFYVKPASYVRALRENEEGKKTAVTVQNRDLNVEHDDSSNLIALSQP